MDPSKKNQHDVLEDAFEKLRVQWDSDDKHRAFLALAMSFNGLPEAASMYRKEGENRPERTEEIEVRLKALTTMALSNLVPTRTERERRPRWLTTLAIVISGLMFAGSVYGLYALTAR